MGDTPQGQVCANCGEPGTHQRDEWGICLADTAQSQGLRLNEIRVRWVVFQDGDKVGEGTTVATTTVLNRMVNSYANKGQRFLWERAR